MQCQRANLRCAVRGIERGVSSQFRAVDANGGSYLRFGGWTLQRVQVLDGRSDIIAIESAKKCPVHWWILAMTAQVWPKDCKARRFIQLHAQIQKPGSVRTITVQEDYSWCTFCPAYQPASRRRPIVVFPINVGGVQRWPGYFGVGFRRYDICCPRRTRNAADNPDRRRNDTKS